jgi:hypothetical protein
MRNIADQRPQPQHADQGQHEAGHEHREQQPVETKSGHGRGHQDDERAGRPADLITATTERRDQKAADDGGV